MSLTVEPEVGQSTPALAPVSDSKTVRQSPAWFGQDKFWVVFWGGLLLATLPFMVPYLRTLWRQELYQYFPFVLLSVGYLAYTRWDRILVGPRNLFAWVVAGVGVSFLVGAALIHSTWLGNLGFVLLCFSFLLSQRSMAGQSLAYLALPLLMLIRIPQLHAQSIVVRLQKITTQLSSLALDVFSVPNDSHGNTISLATKKLFVAEACSGVQSAFTMCFLALLVIVWRKRPLLTVPLFVAAALILAIVANTIRVTLVALAEAWYQVDWTQGFVHDLIGYVTLLLGGAILLSFDALVGLVLHPVAVPETQRGANPFALLWNWALGFRRDGYFDSAYGWDADETTPQSGNAKPVAKAAPNAAMGKPNGRTRQSILSGGVLATAVLAALFMLGGTVMGRGDSRPIAEKDALLFDPPEDFLAGRVGSLTIGDREIVRNGSDPQLGIHADVWACNNGRVSSQMVLSQPFVGWHELCVCYEVQDWKLAERYNLNVASGEPVAVGEFTQGDRYHGYLVFSAIDTDGDVPTPPSYTLWGRIVAPFGPLITDDFAETSGSAQTIMLQLWTISEQPLTAEEIRELAESIATVRDQASQAVVDHQKQLPN